MASMTLYEFHLEMDTERGFALSVLIFFLSNVISHFFVLFGDGEHTLRAFATEVHVSSV